MKKLGLLFVLLLASNILLANEPSEVAHQNLTLAAVDTGSSPSWARPTSSPAPEASLDKVLEEKTSLLNEKINAQLEKALEEKLSRELAF